MVKATADGDVFDHEEDSRFEIRVGDQVAGFAEYESRPGQIVFTHTEVADEFEGKGLAGRLVGAALDEVRSRGLGVVPLCPYVAGYIDKHPEYADLVAPTGRPGGGDCQ